MHGHQQPERHFPDGIPKAVPRTVQLDPPIPRPRQILALKSGIAWIAFLNDPLLSMTSIMADNDMCVADPAVESMWSQTKDG
jgi:hypothetical protein